MIQKDLQGNLWECKIGTMSSGKTLQTYQQEIERLKKQNEETNNRALKIFKGNIERAKEIENLKLDLESIKTFYGKAKELVKEQQEEITRLNNRIDKAIEYIEAHKKQ